MSVVKLKREIETLWQALNVGKNKVAVVFHIPIGDSGHGCFGSTRMIMDKNGGKTTYEPLSYEEELALFSRDEYEDMVQEHPHMKTEVDHIYGTYEKWLEFQRCKCGHHGEDGKQPSNGVTVSDLLKEHESLTPEEKAAQAAETLEEYRVRQS